MIYILIAKARQDRNTEKQRQKQKGRHKGSIGTERPWYKKEKEGESECLREKKREKDREIGSDTIPR